MGDRQMRRTYELFGLFDAGVDLGDVSLGILIESFHLVFSEDL